jgi:hypothetical protein
MLKTFIHFEKGPPMKITFTETFNRNSHTALVVPVPQGTKFTDLSPYPLGPEITARALDGEKNFSGRLGETLTVRTPMRNVIVVGTGRALGSVGAHALVKPLCAAFAALDVRRVVIDAAKLGVDGRENASIVTTLADEMRLYSRVREGAENVSVLVATPNARAVRRAFSK